MLQGGRRGPGFWEYYLTHLDSTGWSKPFALPSSRGRSSTRINAALDKDQGIWLAWDTDSRTDKYFHRPLHQRVHAGRIPPPPAAATATASRPEARRMIFRSIRSSSTSDDWARDQNLTSAAYGAGFAGVLIAEDLNALTGATTVTGRDGFRAEAISIPRLRALLSPDPVIGR